MKKFELGGIVSKNRNNYDVLDNQEFVVSKNGICGFIGNTKFDTVKTKYEHPISTEMYKAVNLFFHHLANEKGINP